MCVCYFAPPDSSSQCAVSCGHGYQMRAVRCVSGAYGDTVDDRECNAALRPRDSQVGVVSVPSWDNNQQTTSVCLMHSGGCKLVSTNSK